MKDKKLFLQNRQPIAAGNPSNTYDHNEAWQRIITKALIFDNYVRHSQGWTMDRLVAYITLYSIANRINELQAN